MTSHPGGANGAFNVEVDQVPNERWDKIIAGFLDAHHEQTACYASKHWKGRDSHLLLSENGEPVAGARVTVFKLPLLGRGLAFLRFGPFWRPRNGEADPRIYRAMLDALVQEYCVARGLCLTVIPRPSPVHQEIEYALLREAGFSNRRKMTDAERYIVDVSLSEDDQLKSFSKKWRYSLRQAKVNDLEIRFGETQEEIDAFTSLYKEMVSRKKFDTPTPVHMTGELMAGLPTELRPRLIVAVYRDEIVAGATVGIFGDTAYYMFGATSATALPLGAGYALQWWIVQWLHAEGVAWYDLGGAANDTGLRHFKKGLVGKGGRIVVMEGEHDFWASPLGRLSADAVFGLRHGIRQIRRRRGGGNAKERLP